MRAPKSVLIMLLLVLSCTGVPALKHDPAVSPAASGSCAKASITRPMRFVHSIEATLKGNSKAFIIGITVADPAKRTLDSAVMSIEGLVLFQARYDKKITVTRAVDIFSSPQFAESMMNDIALMFFAPEARMTASGTSRGSAVCRYENGDEIIDIIPGNGSWQKKLYREGKCMRTVKAWSIDEKGIPTEIELVARGESGYSLYLKLISAEEIGR